MTGDMSLDALETVALVRIADWEPADDLDVRELEDGALVYLEVPFEEVEHDPDAVLEALADAVGPLALAGHHDERGVFVFPDAADPAEAQTYDAVLAEVGELGSFLPLALHEHDDAGEDPFALSQHQAAEALQGALFGTLEKAVAQLGFGSVEELQAVLQSQDPEVQKLAQIKMMGALERVMPAASDGLEGHDEDEDEDDGPAGKKPGGG
jgi:hypothetical protein